jgi:predicted secreted protein
MSITAQWEGSTYREDKTGVATFYPADEIREVKIILQSFQDFQSICKMIDIQEYNAANQAKTLLKIEMERVFKDAL